jgi:hypothetical protein
MRSGLEASIDWHLSADVAVLIIVPEDGAPTLSPNTATVNGPASAPTKTPALNRIH